jgi:hypothetical protein
MTPRLETALRAYIVAIGGPVPAPWGVSDDRLAGVLEQAIVDGRPVPADYDWWGHLPPDAVA